MSSPSRKRQKLSSPKPSTSIETIPISSESEDEDKPQHIPFIQVEDISDDSDSGKDIKPNIHIPLVSRASIETPSSSSVVNSPMKMLSQANLFDNLLQSGIVPTPQPSTSNSSSRNIEVSKADSQSNVISTTTTMLSPFSNESKISTLGSPRYMVQEISSTVVTHKRFLLTGLNNCKHETKERIKIMIKQLGGEYIECPNFVERCTHIVLGKPNTGEKFMGGLMTGKWLLKTEYVEDSYADGYWLEEESYEWTKDTIERSTNNPDSDPELAKLASSARRCRLRYNAEGPFHGWTASILSNHPRRLECYERLFKAGGGRVINIQDYRRRHNELTFILVDNPDQTHIPLKNPSVPLLRINYIHNVVLEDERPDMSLYKVKLEDKQNELPTVPWLCTFSNVRKQINLTSKKCPRTVLDYIDGVMCSETWGGILLPLTNNQAPPPHMLRSVVNRSLLPRPSSEFCALRQVMSDLYILSWFIPPSHVNRDYYANLMQIKDKPHNADTFLALLEDAVKEPEPARKYPQSPRYLIFWLSLLEKDFYNWERRPHNLKPLVERIMNSWHYSKPVFKMFLKSYAIVMTSEHANDQLKMAMNSHLIVYFTSNEIKRVAKKEEPYQAGNTLDVIVESVLQVVRTILKSRDIRRVHILIHMLSFSYTLMINVFNKVLVGLNQSTVPEHYRVLAGRPPSWEKFYNFFLYVRYDDPSPPNSTYTTDIYLVLLSAMFTSLLSELSKPPSELNPLDKTLDLQRTLAAESEISLASRLMLKLLAKSLQ